MILRYIWVIKHAFEQNQNRKKTLVWWIKFLLKPKLTNSSHFQLFSAQKAYFSIHVIAKYRPMMGKIWEHRPLLVTAPWTSHWVTAVIPCKPGQSQRGESYTLSFHGIQSARLVIYESFIQKRSTHKKYLRYQSILILFRQKGRF